MDFRLSILIGVHSLFYFISGVITAWVIGLTYSLKRPKSQHQKQLKKDRLLDAIIVTKQAEHPDKRIAELEVLLKESKENEEKFQNLIEQASYAIYIAKSNGEFVNVNKSMCRLFNYTKDELLKSDIWQLTDDKRPEIFPIPVRNKPVIIERKLICKNGSAFDAELDMSRFDSAQVFVVIRDLTVRKQMESSLQEAELKFRMLADRSSVGIYLIQKENYIYVNQKFANAFGYERTELLKLKGSLIDKVITEDCWDVVRANIEARHSGKIDFVNYEVTGKKKDGNIIHVEFSGSRIIIGGESTIIGTMIDVSDRWEKENLLRRYQANLQTILEITDTAYTLFDKELNVTAFNQAAVDFVISQYHHQPAKGDQLSDYFPKDRFPQFLAYAKEVLQGENISYEISYPQSDGSQRWYYVRLFPITDSRYEIFGLVLALSDISERKSAEEQLKAAYSKIHDHANSIKDMAWKQSHLIRSPLANLKGLMTILQDEPGDHEIIDKIQLELQRLDDIIIEMAKDVSAQDN